MHEIQGRAVGTHSAKHARAGVSGLTYLPTIYTFIFVNTVINIYVCLTLLLIRHPPPVRLSSVSLRPCRRSLHRSDKSLGAAGLRGWNMQLTLLIYGMAL